MLETASNLLDPNSGDDTTAVSVSGGAILVTQTLAPFGPTSSETITSIELRSPVRQADQYVLFERTYVNTALDVDGDMRQDAVEVAVYSRVIGEEDAILADGTAMKALRVDTAFLSRFKRSSDGQYTAVSQALQSTWYAVGFGPIRRTLTTPGVTGANAVDVDERLGTYDGVTTGYGYLPPQPAVAALNAGSIAGLPLGETVGVAAFDDHGLVFTKLPADPTGAAVSVVDIRGGVISTQVYPNLIGGVVNATFSTDFVQVVRAGQGAGVLTAFTNGAVVDLRLHLFDALGTLLNGPSGVTISIGATSTIGAAFDGTRLWVLWQKEVFNPATHMVLVMRAFDAQGSPVGSELVLEDPPIGTSLWAPRIAAGSGRAVVTWSSLDFSGANFLYASTAGASLAAGMPLTLATVPGAATVDTGLRPALSAGGDAALLWHGSLLNRYQPDTAARGVALDANLQPLRSRQGSIDLEALSLSLVPTGAASDFLTAGNSSSIFIVRTNPQGKAYQDDPSNFGYIEVARLTGGSPLATATPRHVRVPLSPVTPTSDPPRAVLAFIDRVLLFGGDQKTVVTNVWAVDN